MATAACVGVSLYYMLMYILTRTNRYDSVQVKRWQGSRSRMPSRIAVTDYRLADRRAEDGVRSRHQGTLVLLAFQPRLLLNRPAGLVTRVSFNGSSKPRHRGALITFISKGPFLDLPFCHFNHTNSCSTMALPSTLHVWIMEGNVYSSMSGISV